MEIKHNSSILAPTADLLQLARQEKSSLLELFQRQPEEVQREVIAQMTDRELEAVEHDWQVIGRPEQWIPEGNWIVWLILAGRGWGKTRTGAETVREWVKTNKYVNLIGATLDDARDVMIEGESGIMNICSNDDRPRYVGRELQWPNGAKSLIFTADEPERLRGKQHMKGWGDEICAWRYPEAWDQFLFGLRLGKNPQAVVTTTPKPVKLLKDIMDDQTTVITRGTTYRNRANLADAFLKKVITKYEGTRLGRQELNAEVLADNPGALWKRRQIDDLRVGRVPCTLVKVVVAIDPAATSNPDSDETGIVVVGLGSDGHCYVLADLTILGSPKEWGTEAVNGYHDHKADRIVGETNNGGEMVEYVITSIDKSIPFTGVHASRGKITRAEPVSTLYEKGECHHVGFFPALEDQMCDYDPKFAKYSPDRMDALVWAITELKGFGVKVTTGFLDFYGDAAKVKEQAYKKLLQEQKPVVSTPSNHVPHTGFIKQ